MTVSEIQVGGNTIDLLKDIFNITESDICEISLHAKVNEATTINVTRFLRAKEVDITTKILTKQTTISVSKYEITIKQIGD